MWQTSDGVYFIPPAPEILELSKPEQNSLSKDNDLADTYLLNLLWSYVSIQQLCKNIQFITDLDYVFLCKNITEIQETWGKHYSSYQDVPR